MRMAPHNYLCCSICGSPCHRPLYQVILPPEDQNEDDELLGGAATRGDNEVRQQQQQDQHQRHAPSGATRLGALGRGSVLGYSQEGGSGGGGRRMAARANAAAAARQLQLRVLMRGARELAVMTSVSHPNIVQVRVGARVC